MHCLVDGLVSTHESTVYSFLNASISHNFPLFLPSMHLFYFSFSIFFCDPFLIFIIGFRAHILCSTLHICFLQNCVPNICAQFVGYPLQVCTKDITCNFEVICVQTGASDSIKLHSLQKNHDRFMLMTVSNVLGHNQWYMIDL